MNDLIARITALTAIPEDVEGLADGVDKLAERLRLADRQLYQTSIPIGPGATQLIRDAQLLDKAASALRAYAARIAAQDEEIARLRKACMVSNDAICQTLGKALMYPWFKDDQKNFPGATEENGVCVGEHVAESLVSEAAKKLAMLTATPKNVERLCKFLDEAARYFENRPVNGEDRAHWANVYNAENARKSAIALRAYAAREAKLRREVEAIAPIEGCGELWNRGRENMRLAVIALIDQQEDKP